MNIIKTGMFLHHNKGQNFLKNHEIIKQIVDKSKINESDVVFEIGPGNGNLTNELLKIGKRVIVCELDK